MATPTYRELMIANGADPKLLDTSERLIAAIRGFSAEVQAIDPTVINLMIYRDENDVPGQIVGVMLNRSEKLEAARLEAQEGTGGQS